jgi:hypothetical protein
MVVAGAAACGLACPTASTTAVRVEISAWRATPESTTAMVTPAPFRVDSTSGATG